MATNGTRFTFAAGSVAKDTFAVVNFQLSQAYSELFTLDVTLASSDPAVGFEKVLDEMATLTIWQGEEIKRRVRGIVTFCEQGDTGKHQTLYRLTIRPNLWRSAQRRNCRSFQNLDIEGILKPLLKEMGIVKYDTLFRARHDWREFCVQFMESDYEFIRRLTAEEGIFFFEEEYLKANDQKLAFADNCTVLTSMGQIPYNPNAASEADTYCINNFRRSAQIRPSQVTLQDYTFTAPNWPAQFQDQPRRMPYQHAAYEIYDYPGRFKNEQHGEDFARYQIEGWRNNADRVTGTSNSPRIQPGLCFALTDHPREDLNTQWQVVACEIQGDQPQALIGNEGQGTTLSSQFQVIPATQTWRSVPHPKPRIDGPQIAIVTGPPGEEIFCDEHGRVRVKFAWDRYNKANEGSSCWIRVSQAWAGTGFGNIAIPRVGQEVIVDFLNGDPDQPIITGRTYHAINRSPGDLPGTKTQMAIRSQTYKGSGYNELMFEDATAQELLSIHAQKDMKTKVLNNQFNNIQHDREKVIGNDQRLSVGRDDTIVVERDRHTSIKGGLHLDVKSHREEFSHANYHSETAGDYSRLTEGKETIFTGKENSTQAKRIILKGNEKIDIQGPMGSVTIDETGIMLDAPVIKLRGKVEILTPVINSLTGGNGGGRDFNNAVIQASAFSVADDDKSLNSPSPDDSSEGSFGEKSEGEEDDNKYKVRFLLENDEKNLMLQLITSLFPQRVARLQVKRTVRDIPEFLTPTNLKIYI